MENDNENERLNEDNKKNIKTEKKERVVNEVLEWIFCIVIAVVLAFLIKGFVGTFTTVKQESMYPTLKNDQRLWLDRTVRTFNRRI
jgi:signal peptidase I